MKLKTQLLAILSTLFLLYTVQASERHHGHDDHTIVNNVTNISNQSSEGIALGLAFSAIDFSNSKTSLQFGVGVSSYDFNNAIAFGIGKKIDNFLIKGTVGKKNDGTAAAFGVTWEIE